MRHKMDTRKFGRTSAHRKAMWRNMATSLFREGRIRTTEAKAKELRRVADRLVTIAKRADRFEDADEQKVAAHRLHLRRQALGFIQDRDVVAKLFDEIAAKYVDRNGGYTRVLKIGPRKGDGAPMAIIELVEEELDAKPKKKSRKASSKKKDSAKAPAKSAKKAKAAKPADEKPAEEKPVEDAAVEEAPVEESAAVGDPVAEEPVAEETTDEAPDGASDDEAPAEPESGEDDEKKD